MNLPIHVVTDLGSQTHRSLCLFNASPTRSIGYGRSGSVPDEGGILVIQRKRWRFPERLTVVCVHSSFSGAPD